MNERTTSTLEQVVAVQADELLETARKNGHTDTKWTSASLQKALSEFHSLYEQASVLAVFAEIGPHPDFASDEDRTPSTLILTPIFRSLTVSEHLNFYYEEERIRDLISPNTFTSIDRSLDSWYTMKEVEETVTGTKIYPIE